MADMPVSGDFSIPLCRYDRQIHGITYTAEDSPSRAMHSSIQGMPEMRCYLFGCTTY